MRFEVGALVNMAKLRDTKTRHKLANKNASYHNCLIILQRLRLN